MYPFSRLARRFTVHACIAVALALVTNSEAGAATAALTISGAPKTVAITAQYYYFIPTTSGRDPTILRFSVTGKPAWASLSQYSGTLYGVPQVANVGTYSNIVITVTDGKTSVKMAPFSLTVKTPSPTNHKPTISGAPSTQVVPGSAYSFKPTSSDADGDALHFLISNRPTWAAFNTATGALTGTPTAAQVGTYSNIIITASDGQGGSSSLPAFNIAVVQSGNGAATVMWTPPTANNNGSTLTNLAGYRIYYGTQHGGPYSTTVNITNPSLSSYVISNLVPATYYFVVASRNSAGVESAYSKEASKTVK